MYTALGMSRPGKTAQDLVNALLGSAHQHGYQHAGIRPNQVAPAPNVSVAQKPSASYCSPGMVAATAAGAAAGAAIFTAVALDTGMLGGEGGGMMADAMANLSTIDMPEMPVDVDLAPVGEALAGLGDMAGTAVGGAGEAVSDLGARLVGGFDGMGGMDVGDAAGGFAEAGGTMAEGIGDVAGAGAAWVGDAGGQAYQAVANVDEEGSFMFFLARVF